MQVSDMKALKTLYTHKPNFLSHQFRLSIHQNPKFRHISHSSIRLCSSQNAEPNLDNGSEPPDTNSRPVWSVYTPVSDDAVSRLRDDGKGVNLSDSSSGVAEEGEKNVNLSNLNNGLEAKGEKRESLSSLDTQSGNGAFGSVGRVSSSNEFEREGRNNVGLSDSNSGFKGEGEKQESLSSSSSQSRSFDKQRAYGGDRGEAFGSVGRVSSGGGLGFGEMGGKKKKGKRKVSWVCSDCGYTVSQWWGECRSCNAMGTMKPFTEVEPGKSNSGFEVSENVMRSWLPQQAGGTQPIRLRDVSQGISRENWRIPLPGTFGDEVSRVLGGGLVPGSLVLLGGDPGVGKSTFALQIAAVVANGSYGSQPAPVVYISGEESVEQIGNRAERMEIATEELFLYSSTDIEDILEKIQPLNPRALVIDSIQTVYLKGVTGSAGGIYQVKECTSALLRFAKKTNYPVLLIGHVTKSGDIAGPRVLEHIVDVVLYMEGEKNSTHRLLRSVKNRFGSTDELGVFEMLPSGLETVSNPSEMFLSEQETDSDVFAGLAVAIIMDGSRSFLIEIQALSLSGRTYRQFNGVQSSRAEMIISVLIKQAGLQIQENGIFLNVVSGLTLTETAGDLAIAAAICSSFLEFPIPAGVAFIGEIGLGGELRSVPRMEKRISTVAKLGYKKCVVPKSAEKCLTTLGHLEIEIAGCRNLKDMINSIFQER